MESAKRTQGKYKQSFVDGPRTKVKSSVQTWKYMQPQQRGHSQNQNNHGFNEFA